MHIQSDADLIDALIITCSMLREVAEEPTAFDADQNAAIIGFAKTLVIYAVERTLKQRAGTERTDP
jgi:hypothetical protein